MTFKGMWKITYRVEHSKCNGLVETWSCHCSLRAAKASTVFRDGNLVELAERDIVHRDLAAVCTIVRRGLLGRYEMFNTQIEGIHVTLR
jgi:hypothetical protein